MQLKDDQIKNIVADTKNTYYQMSLAYSRYWQDEKRLNAEITKIQNDFALSIKRYNLDLHEERNEVTQGYLKSLFEGLGIILHGATFSTGQQSFTKKSETRTYTDKKGKQQTVTTNYE